MPHFAGHSLSRRMLAVAVFFFAGQQMGQLLLMDPFHERANSFRWHRYTAERTEFQNSKQEHRPQLRCQRHANSPPTLVGPP